MCNHNSMYLCCIHVLDFVLNHIVCLFYNMYIYAYTMEVMTNYATGQQLQPYITCVIEYGHNIYISELAKHLVLVTFPAFDYACVCRGLNYFGRKCFKLRLHLEKAQSIQSKRQTVFCFIFGRQTRVSQYEAQSKQQDSVSNNLRLSIRVALSQYLYSNRSYNTCLFNNQLL